MNTNSTNEQTKNYVLDNGGTYKIRKVGKEEGTFEANDRHLIFQLNVDDVRVGSICCEEIVLHDSMYLFKYDNISVFNAEVVETTIDVANMYVNVRKANDHELHKLTNIVRSEGKMGAIIKELPVLIAINREYANDWENFISLGHTDRLNEFVSKVSKEINSHDTSATADVISFWGYVLYLLTSRRVITEQEIAKLNKELEGGVGDIIFGR